MDRTSEKPYIMPTEAFQDAGITNSDKLLQEITRRANSSTACPYTRQANITKCCTNYTGSNCDQIANGNSSQLADNSPLPFATCVLWGLFHYRTFDGTHFEFTGGCKYKLSGTRSWQVNFEPQNCSRYETCVKSLSMLFGSVTVVATGHNVTVNNIQLGDTDGITVSGVTIERRGNYTRLVYSDGVRVKWDDATVIDVTVDESFNGQVTGLCGDYNGVTSDDLTLTDGTVAPTAAVFGNDWRLDTSCSEVPSLGQACSTAELQLNATSACQILSDPSDIFSACLQVVDSQRFYNACLIDYCITSKNHPEEIQSALCNSYSALARECTDNFLDISWRTKDRCPKNCPNDMEYVECASNCPKTCQSLNQSLADTDNCKSDCSPGCICPNGTVLDLGQNQQCVQPQQCSCYYRGQYYPVGYSITSDCNQCTCRIGTWSCSKIPCARTCTVFGNGHIDTFDKKKYTLTGACQYSLLEGLNPDSSNKLRVMYTSTENITTNELIVSHYENIVTIKGNQIIINGVAGPALPYKLNDLVVRLATSVLVGIEGANAVLIEGLCGTYNYITRDDYVTPNGLIEANLIGFAEAYKTSATCTTPKQTTACNVFPANELKARETCQTLLKDAVFSSCSSVFDPSFYIESCTADLCSDLSADYQNTYTCYHLAAYAHECASRGIIIDWMSSPQLSTSCKASSYGSCNNEMKYTECVSSCAYSCSDLQLASSSCDSQCLPGCLCPSNTYYDVRSRSCIAKEQCSCWDEITQTNVEPHQTVFRSCTNCTCLEGKFICNDEKCLDTMQCPANQIFTANASTCPVTCDNRISYNDCGTYKQGCACPQGYVLTHDGVTCVPENSCPCRYNEHSYSTGEEIRQSCNNCTCVGGTWICTKNQCDGTCIASGDPHYTTFDGFRYAYQGNCQYYLAKEINNLFSVLAENVPCGTTGVTCTKSIIIDYKGASIDLVRGRNVMFNGIELETYTTVPQKFGDVSVFVSGVFVVISSPDFLIKWDQATRIYLTVVGQHRGHMQGLCGNYNDDNGDDITTAQGITASIVDMANSWKTSLQCANLNDSVVDNSDPCSGHDQRRDWATTECALIRAQSDDNPFNPCIELMDPTQLDMHYKECLFDACNCDRGGDCECLCTALASFGEQCNTLGVAVKWRKQDRCPMQCENGKVYMACGPICPNTCSAYVRPCNQFSCKNARCIPKSWVCDGVLDCGVGDDSDETSDCRGACINQTQMCDGTKHCPKGDDEDHPQCSTTNTTPQPQTTTTQGQSTTTTIDFCSLVQGMNQPLDLVPEDVTILSAIPPYTVTDLNPNSTGISFYPQPDDTPSIIYKFPQESVVTTISIPPPSITNVEVVTAYILYPNDTRSDVFTSGGALTTTTSTTPSGQSTPSSIGGQATTPTSGQQTTIHFPQDFVVPVDSELFLTFDTTTVTTDIIQNVTLTIYACVLPSTTTLGSTTGTPTTTLGITTGAPTTALGSTTGTPTTTLGSTMGTLLTSLGTTASESTTTLLLTTPCMKQMATVNSQ
ncbi:unnamed protein product, partial [Didymodactylos carnosus]